MTCPTAQSLEVKRWLDTIASADIHDTGEMLEVGRAIHNGTIPAALMMSDHPASKVIRQGWSVWSYSLNKPSPAKTWWNAPACHASVYRALRIDRADPCATYAALPFRPAKIDGEWRILAAVSPPRLFDDSFANATHLDVGPVISWNPRTGSFAIADEKDWQVIQPDYPGDEANIYGDFFAFARAWAENRAIFYQRRMDQVADKWVHPVSEPRDGNLPGYLVVGDIGKVRLPREMPAVLHSIGIPAKALNAAIFRTANLPRVNESIMRVAA